MKRTLLRNIFNDDIKVNDKLKFIEERVSIIEKNLPNLRNKITDYVDKKTAEKKCMDKIILVLKNFSDSENVCVSTKLSVDNFSKVLSDITDQYEILVSGMNAEVNEDLMEIGKRCKHIRSDLKVAVDREVTLQRQLQRLEMLRHQEHDRLTATEADSIKARKESSKAAKSLEEHIDIFELKKLQTLRSALLNWTKKELRYHARCLELFTSAYRSAAEINVSSDHQEFRSKLNGSPPNTRFNTGWDSSIEIASVMDKGIHIGSP